jgi:hypothetical protein
LGNLCLHTKESRFQAPRPWQMLTALGGKWAWQPMAIGAMISRSRGSYGSSLTLGPEQNNSGRWIYVPGHLSVEQAVLRPGKTE